jgi:hypothetical protein
METPTEERQAIDLVHLTRLLVRTQFELENVSYHRPSTLTVGGEPLGQSEALVAEGAASKISDVVCELHYMVGDHAADKLINPPLPAGDTSLTQEPGNRHRLPSSATSDSPASAVARPEEGESYAWPFDVLSTLETLIRLRTDVGESMDCDKHWVSVAGQLVSDMDAVPIVDLHRVLCSAVNAARDVVTRAIAGADWQARREGRRPAPLFPSQATRHVVREPGDDSPPPAGTAATGKGEVAP